MLAVGMIAGGILSRQLGLFVGALGVFGLALAAGSAADRHRDLLTNALLSRRRQEVRTEPAETPDDVATRSGPPSPADAARRNADATSDHLDPQTTPDADATGH